MTTILARAAAFAFASVLTVATFAGANAMAGAQYARADAVAMVQAAERVTSREVGSVGDRA